MANGIGTAEREVRKELLMLIMDHPDLPVFFAVGGDIDGYDNDYWYGRWASAHIGEYVVTPDHSRIAVKSIAENNPEWILNAFFPDHSDKEEWYWGDFNNLPWKKAIIVTLELPDIE